MNKKFINLPADEAAHKEIIEWWYLNGHLISGKKNFGFALAFFKVHFKKLGIVLEPITPEVGYVTHLGITDLKQKKFYCGGDLYMKLPLLSRIDYRKLNLRYGPNILKKQDDNYLLKMINVRPKQVLGINLKFKALTEPLLHGQDGIINMANRGKSFYYSQTNMPTAGALRINSKKYTVKGISWLDHQWGPFYVNRDTGWNWFSIYLSTGAQIMAFNFYDEANNKITPNATIYYPNGDISQINDPQCLDFEPIKWWRSTKSGTNYPLTWRLQISDKQEFDLKIKAKLEPQEVVIQSGQYWEGVCVVTGKIDKHQTHGQAYMELTGYDRLTKINNIIKEAAKL